MAMNPTSSHNVNNFYRAKSHDNTPAEGFIMQNYLIILYSQAIMHENKSGF